VIEYLILVIILPHGASVREGVLFVNT
jgi:hypothetical protein